MVTLSDDIPADYSALVSDLLADEDIQRMQNYVQHHNSTRLLHSLNVSYLAWWFAKGLHRDESAAARAGLLHDFCLYDFHDAEDRAAAADRFSEANVRNSFMHPRIAAKMSQKKFDLSEREVSAIRTHMFPLGPVPKNSEAWLITLADKICAVTEALRIPVALTRGNRLAIA